MDPKPDNLLGEEIDVWEEIVGKDPEHVSSASYSSFGNAEKDPWADALLLEEAKKMPGGEYLSEPQKEPQKAPQKAPQKPQKRPQKAHQRKGDWPEYPQKPPKKPTRTQRFKEVFRLLPEELISKVCRENANFPDEKISQVLETFNQKYEKNLNFNIVTYKTVECQLENNCKNMYCPFYHYQGEKRRPITSTYQPQMCPKLPSCPQKDDCKLAHSLNEVLYHPQSYNSLPCPLPKPCLLEKFCSFYHETSSLEYLFLKEEETELEHSLYAKEKELMDLHSRLSKANIQLDEERRKVICSVCRVYPKASIGYPCLHSFCEFCQQQPHCTLCKSNVYKYLIA